MNKNGDKWHFLYLNIYWDRFSYLSNYTVLRKHLVFILENNYCWYSANFKQLKHCLSNKCQKPSFKFLATKFQTYKENNTPRAKDRYIYRFSNYDYVKYNKFSAKLSLLKVRLVSSKQITALLSYLAACSFVSLVFAGKIRRVNSRPLLRSIVD